MNETPKLLRLSSISKKGSSTLHNLLVRCHVTPSSRGVEGVKRISNEQVYIHVASEPRKGEANAAVARVLAEVLGVPKSDVSITSKQRMKVACVRGIDVAKTSEEEYLSDMKEKLEKACSDKRKEP